MPACRRPAVERAHSVGSRAAGRDGSRRTRAPSARGAGRCSRPGQLGRHGASDVRTWATAVMTSVGGTAWRAVGTGGLFKESCRRRTAQRGQPPRRGIRRQLRRADRRGRAAGITPREVVEQGDLVGRHPRRRRCGSPRPPPHGPSPGSHAVPRVDAHADGELHGVAGVGQDDPIARTSSPWRPTSGRTTVPPPISWRSGGSWRPSRRCSVCQQRQHGGGRASSTRRPMGCRVGCGHPQRAHAGACHRGGTRCPGRARRHRGAHDEAPVAAERAEVGELHTVAVAPGAQRPAGQVGRRRPSAPAPRQPDLPGLESWVLERDHIELYVGADALGHLADRRRQPAGSAVGDRRPEHRRAVGSGEHVDQPLLGDRVADLHAGAGDAGRSSHPSSGWRTWHRGCRPGRCDRPARRRGRRDAGRSTARHPATRCTRRRRAGWW